MTTRLGVVALAGPDNGGTYQYTLSTLQALRHVTGFDITVYGDPVNPDFAALGFPVTPFAETPARRMAALAAYRLGVKLPDPFAAEDVLLAPIYSPALLHTSKPFVYTLHDLQERYYPENFSRLQRSWRKQIHRALLARAGRVISESRCVETDIISFFGTPAERMAVMPAPPQLQFQSPQGDAQLLAARARLRLPERFLFYPAQFWPHKNHLRLIEAFRIVANAVPDLGLVLTGKPRDQYAVVRSAIDKLGLNERVLHLGYVEREDLQAIYQSAAALVMPSLFESVSIPIYEAFQLGTPVVASGILAIPEQVGDAGLLFDPTSVTSMSEAMLEVVRDRDAARSRAARGRMRMRDMTAERYGAQLQRLLRELSDRPAQKSRP